MFLDPDESPRTFIEKVTEDLMDDHDFLKRSIESFYNDDDHCEQVDHLLIDMITLHKTYDHALMKSAVL